MAGGSTHFSAASICMPLMAAATSKVFLKCTRRSEPRALDAAGGGEGDDGGREGRGLRSPLEGSVGVLLYRTIVCSLVVVRLTDKA